VSTLDENSALPLVTSGVTGNGNEAIGSVLTGALKQTRVRYLILAMVFIVTTLNNADRATLSITGSAMQSEMGFNSITLGYLFSSFAWAYMLGQIPGGFLLDRFGSKRVYAASIFFWSLTTLLQAFVPILAMPAALFALFLLRIAVGVAEAPAFPGNSRLVAAWFPAAERGTAAAVFNSAQYFAPVTFTPLMGWITASFGWPHVYIVMGVIGMLLAAIWLLVIHAPTQHPLVNKGELDYIRAGGALVDIDGRKLETAPAAISSLGCLKQLLTSRMMLGVYAGKYCITTLVYFFLTWFPIYLVKQLNMPIMKAGFVAALPAICGFLGGILGGLLSDLLLRRGHSVTLARKTPIVIGLLLASSVIGCAFAGRDQTIVVAIIALAYFGKGFGSLGWAVVSDTSPKEAAALSGGLFNTFANLAGITTPIIIGYIVETTGSFNGALMFVGANAIAAVLCFLLITQKIERIQLAKGSALDIPGLA
jgi:ACS family glucarate transporter-like MFS transporter